MGLVRHQGEESALSSRADPERAWIGGLLLLYLAASLLHFTHNAEYLADYPNLPVWLSRSDVYLVWLGLAAVGIGGYALYRSGWRLAGCKPGRMARAIRFAKTGDCLREDLDATAGC